MIALMMFLRSRAGIWLGALMLVLSGLALAYFSGVGAGVQKDQKRSAPIIKALKKDLSQCRSNNATLEATLGVQNKAVETLRDESDAKVEEANKAAQAAKKQTVKAEAAKAYILAHPPVGHDQCARLLNVDETFLETLSK